MTFPNSSWTQAPSHPVLSDNEVHVWRASLDGPTADYVQLLSTDEQTKAQRFLFEREQRRYIAARGILRIILGRYLNSPPEKLQFEYRQHGKPILVFHELQQKLCFNLSHSEEMVLYAVTLDRQVGIDIEYIQTTLDVGKLAEQFFSPSERAELDALPSNKKLESFFSGWTRKEAYLKARGDGMAFPLDQFTVSMDCEKPAKLLEVKDGPQELSRWSLHALTPAPGYIGTLAVEGNDLQLRQFKLR